MDNQRKTKTDINNGKKITMQSNDEKLITYEKVASIPTRWEQKVYSTSMKSTCSIGISL